VSVAIAELERGGKSFGVGAGERGNAGENFVGAGWRHFLEGNQGVTQKREDAGRRFCFSGAKLAFFLSGEKEMLAELEEERAQVVLDLDAMEIHGDVDAGDNVSAIENTAAVLHVEQLDGENVGGLA
jgi:hypothetical protein